jgi:anti-sigma B factor antagonist
MNYTHETDGDVLILRLTGQLMGGPDAENLREVIQEAFERGIRTVILDMGGVTWVNSAGLGILIAGHLTGRERGASLRFVNLSKRIASILSVTRLSTVFEIFPTEVDARQAAVSSVLERRV